ncbi:MAG: hypothetical protein KF735_25035 [Chelatococcus sp.]|uniref:hypothetical protein n=1 Tax=unclassified Chelatococcus TaxID=2638111 RepID=UPI001BCE62F9|nr:MULTISPECIES: hypothetical protein [unclassified Chelatococcus]CAH1658957.1 conserved hypothetical protein [Hyphomicrobiales bacterium]MBS7740870.1 hypothetical protein [Chelatococcus sp. HY11]MBX3540930.1 hypothetical protein [Chelatococcus sp.]MBX3547463.1 hypothetical protein [Chelatococcus sp.]MCO5079968.1 hypothetical protein [Chelatococcus sp.]
MNYLHLKSAGKQDLTDLLWLEKVLNKVGPRFEISSSVSEDGSEWVAVIDAEYAETIVHIAWIDGVALVASSPLRAASSGPRLRPLLKNALEENGINARA